MFKEEIGNEFIVIQEGTSEGTQIKYRKDGCAKLNKIDDLQ